MRRVVATLAAASSIACVCCTLLVDTDGLQGTPPDALATDGQVDAPVDAELVTDAGRDARTFPDAAVLWPKNGHGYEVVVKNNIPWSQAKVEATLRGGHLVTITSAEENSFVFDLIVATPDAWVSTYGPWIGGFQPAGSAEPSGGWRWVTDEPFVYTNWLPGEPSESGNENSLQFYGNGAKAWTWNDISETRDSIPSFVVEYE